MSIDSYRLGQLTALRPMIKRAGIIGNAVETGIRAAGGGSVMGAGKMVGKAFNAGMSSGAAMNSSPASSAAAPAFNSNISRSQNLLNASSYRPQPPSVTNGFANRAKTHGLMALGPLSLFSKDVRATIGDGARQWGNFFNGRPLNHNTRDQWGGRVYNPGIDYSQGRAIPR